VTRRRSLIVLVAVALVALGAVAWAHWSTSGSGTAVGSVGTLTAPGKPSTSVSGSTISLGWSAAALSGGGSVGYHVERRSASGSTWTDVCSSSDAAPIASLGCSDTPSSFGSYVYRVTARYATWRTAGAESDPVSPTDATPPSFGSPALSFAILGGAAYYPGSGTSVYYNGAAGAGSITVSAPNAADAESGIAKVNFPSPSGFSGGGDDTSSPYSATYTWSSSSASGSQTVTATNGSGGTATTSFSLVRDVTAPTGGAVTVAGSSSDGATVNNTSGSYSITGLAQYAETQTASASGLASSSLVREQADFDADGSCDSTWTGATTISANRTENAGTGIASGTCYRYTLKGTDRVGNSANIQIVVKVDTSGPSFGSPAVSLATSGPFAYYSGSGTSVYYNGTNGSGSSITVSAPNVADADSGIAKVNFPSPSGFSGGGDDSASPFGATYTWSSSSATGSQTLTATNGVGSTATTSFSLVRDVTAPGGGSFSVAGSSSDGATVSNTSGSYSISGLTQYSENQTSSASGLASSSLVREQANFTSAGACDTTWTNSTTISANRTENASTGIASGSCYRYTLKGTDRVGNSADIQITVKVDATGPSLGALTLGASGPSAYYPGSGTSVYYNGTNGSGSSITVSAPNAADADSGIAKVNFPSPSGLSGGGDDTASPFGATYTWSSSSASGSQTVTATNGAGGTATGTFSLVRDVTAPTGGALGVAGASTNGASVGNNTGSYSISTLTQYAEAQSGTASGLAASSLVRDEATYNADGTCVSTWTNATTIAATRTENAATGIASGKCYRYTLKGTDNVGNSASVQITVKVDTAPPTATNVLLGNGGTLGRIGADDTVTISFNEALDASTICSSWSNDGTTQSRSGSSITVSVTNNAANDSLAVSASNGCTLHLGTIALGADYVSSNHTYNGSGGNSSSISWDPGAQTITIGLGSSSGSTGENTNVPASTPSYTASTSIQDLVGNAIAAGPYSGTSTRF